MQYTVTLENLSGMNAQLKVSHLTIMTWLSKQMWNLGDEVLQKPIKPNYDYKDAF